MMEFLVNQLTCRPYKMENYFKLEEDVYLFTSLNNNSKLNTLRSMFDKIEQSQSELTFMLEPEK